MPRSAPPQGCPECVPEVFTCYEHTGQCGKTAFTACPACSIFLCDSCVFLRCCFTEKERERDRKEEENRLRVLVTRTEGRDLGNVVGGRDLTDRQDERRSKRRARCEKRVEGGKEYGSEETMRTVRARIRESKEEGKCTHTDILSTSSHTLSSNLAHPTQIEAQEDQAQANLLSSLSPLTNCKGGTLRRHPEEQDRFLIIEAKIKARMKAIVDVQEHQKLIDCKVESIGTQKGQLEQEHSLSLSLIELEDLAPNVELKLNQSEEPEDLGSPIVPRGPKRWIDLDSSIEEAIGSKRRSISGCVGARVRVGV